MCHLKTCHYTFQTIIDKKTGKELTMFNQPISSRQPYSLLKGQKYIVSYDELPSYARSFMHIQKTLAIADLHWRTLKIDKKECCIFVKKVDEDDSEGDDEDDVSNVWK